MKLCCNDVVLNMTCLLSISVFIVNMKLLLLLTSIVVYASAVGIHHTSLSHKFSQIDLITDALGPYHNISLYVGASSAMCDVDNMLEVCIHAVH